MVTEEPSHRLHRTACAAGEAQPRYVPTELKRLSCTACNSKSKLPRIAGKHGPFVHSPLSCLSPSIPISGGQHARKFIQQFVQFAAAAV